ncbi:Glycoprotein gp2 [Pseudonocardia sp. Ae717_Ps2]|uniref:glucuronyl esterase domain-containing protein n=1 Tax=Pseudonocardia sp. Ae717_Ps2 TaxID=1885573 RepID=UPI00094AF1C4|nr:hypothetical protein [Pseudonocardia sp. Ae717_Ps2]OLM28973.1 Glycoprotein gp2 [Pseudonocardia sp. Ae717_Ps2]
MTRAHRTAGITAAGGAALAAALGLVTGEAAAAAPVMSAPAAAVTATPPDDHNDNQNRDQVDSPVGRWETQDRPQLLHAFAEHVYGRPLPAPDDMTFDVTDLTTGGGAVDVSGKKIVIGVHGPGGQARFTLRLFTPAGREVHGTFLLIDHRGTVGDTGSTSGYAPITQIVGAGYALAALDANEAAPDDPDRYRDGVINAFHDPNQELPENAGRTIAAWAWAASRALDYLHTDDATRAGVDPGRVAVIGHSRGGKAALWAGAQDTRFPVVISNNSGTGGAKPADTGRGETIEAMTAAFPHWFPPVYRDHADRPEDLPVDQHQLLALIAPGRVVVASATDDDTADPQGEHAAYTDAQHAWAHYGLHGTGLPDTTWPPPTDQAFRGPGMSYHLRSGGHGLTETDWTFYLDGNLFTW